jgi:ABC-type dipeptide/oligopeptide/nickel transport system permease component
MIGWPFLVRRSLQVIPLMMLVSLVSFGLMALAPIDPAQQALTAGETGIPVDEQELEAKRRELGLDRPLGERYLRWWGDVVRLDLGHSFTNRRPVAESLVERLPASLTLVVLALGMSIGIGLPMGMVAAVKVGTWLDAIVRLVTVLGASLPGFWLALLAMWLFAVELRWVPALGSFTPQGIILPMLILAVRPIGHLTRLMRATTMDVLNQHYLAVARAKGLSDLTLLRRHVLPNALLPIVTVIGLDFVSLLANASVIEWVFGWPGIGRLGVDAALAGDLPVVMGFVLVVGWIVVLVNVIVDVSYGLLDPKQRTAGAT